MSAIIQFFCNVSREKAGIESYRPDTSAAFRDDLCQVREFVAFSAAIASQLESRPETHFVDSD